MESMSTADLFRIVYAGQVTILEMLARITTDMEAKVVAQEQIELLLKITRAGRQ